MSHRTIAAARAYDRQRQSTEHRRRTKRTHRAAWEAKFPERRAAKQAVRAAVRAGLLVRPGRCQACGQAGKVEAHHQDYTRVLAVVWLCPICHKRADRERQMRERGVVQLGLALVTKEAA